MNKKLIIILLILIAVALLIIVVFPSSKKNQGVPQPTPTPKNTQNNNADSGYITTPKQAEEDNKSFQIGLLVTKLPYHGSYFSLYYRYSMDEFILYLNPSSPAMGNREFDAFLKKNGIGSRSWFNELSIINEDITPEP